MSDERTVDLSLVIPVFNEQDSLKALYDEITKALSGQFTYEVIFIDDGSTDNSFAIIV